MRDQRELALQCLEVEDAGGSVIEFLKGLGFISASATWQWLQLNELGRLPSKLRDGKENVNMGKLTLEDKKKAVQIAVDGGNPLEYIRSCGVKNAAEAWGKIKCVVKETDPEAFEKIPKRLPNPKNPIVIDTPKGKMEITPEKISQMSQEEVSYANVAMMSELVKRTINGAVNYDGFTVRAVQGVYGRYFYDKTSMGEYIDFENNDGDELSMTVDNWRMFVAELKHAAAVLGVEL